MKLRSLYYLPAYWLGLLIFAVGGLEVSALGLLFSWLPASDGVERFFQRYIHYHFRFFLEWCALMDLIHVRYEGLERFPPGGAVVVANHLSLVDIACLLAQVPEAACIFKPAIRTNPLLGAAARRAGYLSSDGGHHLVQRAVQRVTQGNLLVVFPEGTRATPGKVTPFKPGFALIARLAQAPVQLVRIATDSDLLTKGRPILRLPRFPAHITVTIGPLRDSARASSPEALAEEVAAWYRGPALNEPACPPAVAALS